MLAKKFFPDLIDQISQELTPMVATARTIKQEHPNAKVVFIGPCAAKKLEASRRTVRSDVDFVVTFEELQAMFDAKGQLMRQSLLSMMRQEPDVDTPVQEELQRQSKNVLTSITLEHRLISSMRKGWQNVRRS